MAAPPINPPRRPGQKPPLLLELAAAGGDDDELDAVALDPAATGFFAVLNSLATSALGLAPEPEELGAEPAADRLSVLAVDVALDVVEALTLEDPTVTDAGVEPDDAVFSDDVGLGDV